MLNIIYYKSPNGNVGDDLNPWLWPRIFGDLNNFQNLNFIGVGSVLDSKIDSWIDNKSLPKVVFGSGVRDFLTDFDIDNTDINFVRGPISAKAVGTSRFITDSAYCLKLLDLQISEEKKYKQVYVPYFMHMDCDWKLFEKLTGINVISPLLGVEEFISEISKAEVVFTSAMHGAIFSDILRIPWCRVRLSKHGGETLLTSELKWADWCSSMCIDMKTINLSFNLNERPSKTKWLAEIMLLRRAFSNYTEFALSDKSLMDSKVCQLGEVVEAFKSKYKLRN